MNGYWAWEATHVDPASYIPPSKLPMINKAVLDACDKNDGLADGIIDDPRKCSFDPASLTCTGGDAADCLTAPQVTAMKKIYQGPKNPRTGELIFPGMYVGSEINPLGLDRTLANAPDSGRPRPPAGLAYWTNWKGPDYDWDKDASMVISELSPVLDDADPDLSAFKAHGGKLLLYTGWADPLIPAADTLNYYTGMQKKMGGAQATASFARLFMVPGHGPLRRRQRADALRRARRARAVGRERRRAGEDDRRAGRAGRDQADAPDLRLPAGREVERHRQSGRSGQLYLPATVKESAVCSHRQRRDLDAGGAGARRRHPSRTDSRSAFTQTSTPAANASPATSSAARRRLRVLHRRRRHRPRSSSTDSRRPDRPSAPPARTRS